MAERTRRTPLNRERVVTAAVALADEKGEPGVTMRALAGRLGVEAMSLYNHVAGRDDILDGMVDTVFAEIELPEAGADWREAIRDRTASARAALKRHPWAVGLMDSRRRPGWATLRHHDTVLGVLRAGGFSVAMAAHAFSLIDSYLYGYVLQELSLPFSGPGDLDEAAGDLVRQMPEGVYPHLAEMAVRHVLAEGYDYGEEFDFGLTLILGALGPDEA
ncbi:TetR/AcrR family transcriptional regulator [Phytomonospora endophytica]|uniref:AcrR family transcriptional regulator n=1 Tax=Phytomonospora endophytica TaxID=714109 RepID=A0A841FNC8_9ACTN|nr:TetR/AcrR family transcriptional regulator C-terminal domain-containing protein [Phytomonospora endophytica]MBB6034109.1 AcrR family transcriptional regulator [Phytomonospora endophytica]GIG66503.1 TetR family transcriptional regulator [Phytomonospora endophytica]